MAGCRRGGWCLQIQFIDEDFNDVIAERPRQVGHIADALRGYDDYMRRVQGLIEGMRGGPPSHRANVYCCTTTRERLRRATWSSGTCIVTSSSVSAWSPPRTYLAR